MCGIFGTTKNLSEGELHSLKALIHHRGPDSSGEVRIPLADQRQLTFAHTRLAIQDLTQAGHQPMPSADNRWTVTFNGEIYNHHHMRHQLNRQFRGSSDTETLVEMLADVGIEKTLEQLNGIFGFAAYNAETGMLYIVRDHFGTKPVYYRFENEELSFSSEIKPLLALGNKGKSGSASIDQEGLELFLNLRYTPSTKTLLSGIERIPPGHYLCYNTKTKALSSHCYIQPTTLRFVGSFDDAVSAYHDVFKQAVTDQLLSDVPVGILLSGGIDSALVATYATEASNDLTAFTVGFGGIHDECEIADAAETAQVLGLKHESVTVDPLKLVDCLSDIIRSVEEPLGTTSIMPMWYLTECAKRNSTVVLTGQGSDEPWGGYNRYKMELLLQKMPFLKSAIFGPLRGAENLFKNDSIRRGLASLGYSNTCERFLSQYRLFSRQDANKLANANEQLTLDKIQYWMDWLDKCNHDASLPEQMMRVDTRMNLADDLLLYADKISMHYALEARVPMLDKNLVEFVETLPLAYKSNIKSGKLVHKALAKRYLPAQIVNRKKKGFQVPFGDWSRNQWRDYVEAALCQSNNKLFNILDEKTVQSIWQQHASGKLDRSRQIFSLLTLSLWCEHFL